MFDISSVLKECCCRNLLTHSNRKPRAIGEKTAVSNWKLDREPTFVYPLTQRAILHVLAPYWFGQTSFFAAGIFQGQTLASETKKIWPKFLAMFETNFFGLKTFFHEN